jgi:hypothetical protein
LIASRYFSDEMAKASLMPAGNFAEQVPGQLQISLRTVDTDVAKVGDQERQLRLQINVLLVPTKQPMHCEGATEIMNPRPSAS